MISERAKALILEARTIDVATWEGEVSADVIQTIGKADEEKRYLTDEDLKQLQVPCDESNLALKSVEILNEKAKPIVDKAREEVLANFPDITSEGGGLYPPERAEACWRDFWHFLRCITYGIAARKLPFTSPEGLEKMELLYREMKVPLPAMTCGLESLKTAAVEALDAEQGEFVAPYFDHLIEQMKQFND